MPLEPLPETREALRHLSRWSHTDLLAQLISQAELVTQAVPSCVGLSIAMVQHGVTFTLVGTTLDVVALDGVQYAVGGPCVDAVLQNQFVRSGDDEAGLLAEDRWADFARVGAAHGVMSTLSMLIRQGDRVVAGVNIYAGEPNAFKGKQEELATILGAWAPGAVTNADLSFTTRDDARRAPQALEEQAVIDQAVGVVVAARGASVQGARGIIAEAARRAGGDQVMVARALVAALTPAVER